MPFLALLYGDGTEDSTAGSSHTSPAQMPLWVRSPRQGDRAAAAPLPPPGDLRPSARTAASTGTGVARCSLRAGGLTNIHRTALLSLHPPPQRLEDVPSEAGGGPGDRCWTDASVPAACTVYWSGHPRGCEGSVRLTGPRAL